MDPGELLEAELYAAMDEVLAEGKIQPCTISLPTSDHNKTYIYVSNGPDTRYDAMMVGAQLH